MAPAPETPKKSRRRSRGVASTPTPKNSSHGQTHSKNNPREHLQHKQRKSVSKAVCQAAISHDSSPIPPPSFTAKNFPRSESGEGDRLGAILELPVAEAWDGQDPARQTVDAGEDPAGVRFSWESPEKTSCKEYGATDISAPEDDVISSAPNHSGQHTQAFYSTSLGRVHLPVDSHPVFGHRDDGWAHLGHKTDISNLPHFTSVEHHAAGIDITRDNPIEGIAYGSESGWSFVPPKSKSPLWEWYDTKVITDMPWTYTLEENHPAMRAALMLLRGDDGSGTLDAIIRGAEAVVRDAQDGMELRAIKAAIDDVLAGMEEDNEPRQFVGGSSGRGVHLGAAAEERLRRQTLEAAGFGEEAKRTEKFASSSTTVKARKRKQQGGQNHQYPGSHNLRVVDRGDGKEGQPAGSAGGRGRNGTRQ